MKTRVLSYVAPLWILGGYLGACAAEHQAENTAPRATGAGGAGASAASGRAGAAGAGAGNASWERAGAGTAGSETAEAGAGTTDWENASAGEGGARAVHDQVSIESVSPAAHALHVAPLATVTLKLSGPIDATSLALHPVKLFAPHATVPVSAVVKYDAVNHRIELAPALPLTAGTDYRIEVEGLADLTGSSLEWHSQFRVAYQNRTQEFIFDEEGTLTRGALYELDDQGRVKNRLSIGNVGLDAALGTADDVPNHRIAYDFPGTEQRSHHANNAGPDGDWNTADDGFYLHVSVDNGPLSASHFRAVQAPGADGELWTADDVFQDWGVLRFRPDGRATAYDWFGGIGPDQLRFTADDVLKGFQRYDYGPGVAPAQEGFSVTTSYRSGVGADGLWRTADDPCTYHRKTLVDARGLELGTLVLGAGPDGTLCSVDDEVMYAERMSYTERALLAAWEKLGEAGADGIWLTADDATLLSRVLYDYDEEGRLTKQRSFYPGADGVVGTEDDVLESETLFDPR
jgi:hypothetical protein